MKETTKVKFLTLKEWNLIKRYETKDFIYHYKPISNDEIHAYQTVYPLQKLFKDFDISKEDKDSIVRTFWRFHSLDIRILYISLFYKESARNMYCRLGGLIC